LIYNGFLAFAQRDAIAAPKQLAMPVAARMVVGDPITVADAKAILSAVAPDRTLHEPRKRLGEGPIELPRVDLGREETENVSAPAGPIAPVAVRMASTKPAQDPGSVQEIMDQGVDRHERRTPRISRVSLTPDHILASGSLPPGFPMTVIDGVPYWDGGLFDNTPIESLLDLLTKEELENLPIFIVNLFATHSNSPANLREVQERMLEISFESRFFLEHADRDGSLTEIIRNVE
jgi:hypothetical protein